MPVLEKGPHHIYLHPYLYAGSIENKMLLSNKVLIKNEVLPKRCVCWCLTFWKSVSLKFHFEGLPDGQQHLIAELVLHAQTCLQTITVPRRLRGDGIF